MCASLSIVCPANQESEVCRDCAEPFTPTRRWGANPGLYRRCDACRENRRLSRASKKPDFGIKKRRTKSYLKIRDYLIVQAKHEPGGLELGNDAIASATKLGLRTVVRTLTTLAQEHLIEVETFRKKLNNNTWINRRTITLNL